MPRKVVAIKVDHGHQASRPKTGAFANANSSKSKPYIGMGHDRHIKRMDNMFTAIEGAYKGAYKGMKPNERPSIPKVPDSAFNHKKRKKKSKKSKKKKCKCPPEKINKCNLGTTRVKTYCRKKSIKKKSIKKKDQFWSNLKK